MDLTKFKTYNFVPGVPTVTIAKHGIGFSKKAISELGNPSHVKVLINADEKQLAIVVANKNEDGAIKCMDGKNPEDNRNFRINAKDLLYQIAFMLDCPFESLNYRIVGEFFDDNNVMLVDLNRAKKVGDDKMDDEE
jgi:hypothetical protein